MNKNDTALIWFRNDLRIFDQYSLKTAMENHERVIAVYCFDPRQFEETEWGFPKTGKFRAQFLIESIQELRKNLKEQLNVSLLVYRDKPENVIPDLIAEHSVTDIYFQEEWTPEERDVELALRKQLPETEFHAEYDQFMVHPEDSPFDDFQNVPEVFTHFRKKCQRNLHIRSLPELPEAKTPKNLLEETTKIPELTDLGLENFERDSRSAFPFLGGEKEGYKRVRNYFWETKNLAQYKKTRNVLLGKDYSSKLSAWLANGSISPRYVYWEDKKFEQKVTENKSTYWLIFELFWRDYFKYVSLKHGNKFFKLNGISDKNLDWGTDEKKLHYWMKGETGQDFVDANMREIGSTGFMSNRGRQNVNSFWAKEWKQDWRAGAAYFESQLVDYDVHSNWGNWMYNSGVGNDPRDRKFNVEKQADRYDHDKKYRETWLNEPLF